jgi:ribonuclease Z
MNRFPTAQVLNVHERFFLIDCGEGTQLQLRRQRIKLGRLNHIFISHAHGDHLFGLFGLVATLNLLGQQSDIHIYGTKSLETTLQHFRENYWQDLRFEVIHHPINTKVNQVIFENNSMTVETIPLKHRIPTCGFLFKERPWKKNIIKSKIQEYNISVKDIQRIKEGENLILENGEIINNDKLTEKPFKSRSYAYCSDTAYNTKIIPIIENVDLLYHESTFLSKDASLAKSTGHSTAEQAAKIAREAKAGKLLLGHFSARYKNDSIFEEEAKKVFEESIVVNDGDQFPIPLSRNT